MKDNNVEMYSTCNEGKSIIAEIFIRTLKSISKHMTSVSKDVYFDVLDDIVDKTYHRTIKMKPSDVKSNS